MRICVTGLRGIPDVLGGVETHCQELFPRLKRLNTQDEFIVFARRPYVGAATYTYSDLNIVALPAPRSKYFEAVSNTFLAVLHARFISKADVLHIHAIGPALLSPLARVLGLHLVVTHHGKDYDRQKWNRLSKWALRMGEFLALTSCDSLIAVSHSLSTELKRRYPKHAGKIAFIPNGVSHMPDCPTTQRDWKRALGIEKGHYILAVGRFVPEKGFHELIEAFKQIEKTSLKLLIVGKADHEDSYSRGLMREASERILFPGFLDKSRLRHLYQQAALFVLPSHHEGLPISALEAISLGTPVLLSDIVPNRDIGLDAKHYFPVGNVQALREKLMSDFGTFRTDPASIVERFDWDAIARATARIYEAGVRRQRAA